ncbi:hypothetical protein H7827_20505 [Streptomyces sp. JH002]|uniref:hypothetical protein n=1 Tax=Streptomyces TaxID=1883 RepID=UPI001F26A014|nr:MULTISPECIES: hypothetical protein [unclassified Streptomyces]MCU4745628.1 hypothetical protein [Streptomyces sp. G-5]
MAAPSKPAVAPHPPALIGEPAVPYDELPAMPWDETGELDLSELTDPDAAARALDPPLTSEPAPWDIAPLTSEQPLAAAELPLTSEPTGATPH